MILVCEQLEKRLDRIWYKLQTRIVEDNEGISQIDCDEEAINTIERLLLRHDCLTRSE